MNTPKQPNTASPASRPAGGPEIDASSVSALLGTPTLLDVLGVGILVVRADWTVAAANAAWADMVGVRVAECTGQELWAAFSGLQGTPGEDAVRAAMADGVTRWFRIRGGRADGTFDVRVVRLPGAGSVGDPGSAAAGGALLLEVHDVSALVREIGGHVHESETLRDLAHALSEVTESKALLRVLAEAATLHAAADGVAVLEVQESDVEVIATAGAAARPPGAHFPLAGSLTEQAMKRRAPVPVANCTPILTEQLGRTPKDIGPALVVPLIAHDVCLGALAVSRRHGTPPFSEDDERRLRVIADYAALALHKARLLEEVQAASQARSNFLATVSHELRTPLTALTGYGELLADEIIGPMTPQQHEVVERMRSVTQQLTLMIDEILTYSSIEAGREKVRPERVLAAELMRAAATVVEPLARQKGLTLDVAEPDPATALVTDRDKVRQILVNLAGNAVKFTNAGRVDVAVENGNGTVRFRVRDTGVGITAADQGRLFQPFTQVDAGLTRRHGGTGLGLYISQRLARLLGGRIDLESAPGAGSTFTLTLPVDYVGAVTRKV